ncbi:MAG TPA: amidohydrolase family protein, partial [Woeseiaceae bacterium]|nr:amidohydrolase family protein [Woeseiaceae bacterium]
AGFRHQVQDEPDAAAFLADSRFRRGVQALQSRSLVYEVLVFASQLAAVPDFCAACDRHWIVLDHLGKPAIADGGFEVWRKQVTPLRGMPRVQCKLSGLVTEAMNDEGELDPGDLRRYFDAALEIFGPERLMFGSDWPVCLLAADYAEVVDLVTQWAAALSAGERDAIWGETAVRTYALTGES